MKHVSSGKDREGFGREASALCCCFLQVVLMNQMTTRVKTSQLGQSHLIPALGKPGLL